MSARVTDIRNQQNTEGDEPEGRDYEAELRKHRIRRYWIIIIAVVLVILAIVIICLVRKKTSYSEYSVVSSTRRSDAGTAQYIYVGENLYRCSKDGVAAFDKDGNSLWNATYEVSNPQITEGGDYFAVADLNGNNVYLFNSEGALGSINSAQPVIEVSVSAAGYVVLVVEDDGADYIHMYQMDGDHNKIYTIKKSISIDGLPTAVCVSPDGEKLVCAYTGVDDGTMNTQLVFSNFDEVGQNENERVVGGYDYGEELIGHIEFMNDTMVAVYGENSLDFYRIKEYPEALTQVELTYEVNSIFSSDSYVGTIHRDSETGESIVEIYDTDGKLCLNWPVAYTDLTSFRISEDTLVAYGDSHCVVLDFSGREIFNYVFESGIVDLFPTDTNLEFIYINANYVQKIRLE